MSKHIKRIILTIAVALTLCFVGCSEMEADTGSRGGFTIYESSFWSSEQYHLIDNITGVVYAVCNVTHGTAITPAYNADGTLLTKRQLEVGDAQ